MDLAHNVIKLQCNPFLRGGCYCIVKRIVQKINSPNLLALKSTANLFASKQDVLNPNPREYFIFCNPAHKQKEYSIDKYTVSSCILHKLVGGEC